jgi:hypothetical protein
MKWPAVVEAWMYRDPAEVGDALVSRTARIEAPRPAKVHASAPGERDRYYTMARRAERRLHVKQVMRGKR